MVTNEKVASTQRRRWETGDLRWSDRARCRYYSRLAPRRPVCLDLALDLLVLPLSYVTLNVGL